MRPTEEWLSRPGGLAEQLRDIREAAGFTQYQLAEVTGVSQPTISKIERGQMMPSEDIIRRWAGRTGHPEAEPALQALREEGQGIHQAFREQIAARGHAGVQDDYDAWVRSGTLISDFEILVIPGILQTPRYARERALESVRLHGADPDKVEDAVIARGRRSQVLWQEGKTFRFVFTEAAFDYLLAPADVMAEQISALAGLNGLPHVTLGIIPSGSTLGLTPLNGFLMVDDTVVAETFTGSDTLTGPEAARCREIFDEYLDQAAKGDDAMRILAAAAERLRS